MHMLISKGDFIYNQWEEEGCKNFFRKVHELRVNGYRKVEQDYSPLDFKELY